MAELPIRLFELERAFKDHDPKKRELTRYFPVALVAVTEGYFRMTCQEIVDAGEPYLTNSERLASSFRLDYSVLRALHGKSVSIGELVAHSIPLSRLDHVDSALSSLLGFSFLDRLRTVTDRWAHEVRGEPAAPMLPSPNETYRLVARAFELRHIVCHEIASAYSIEHEEVAAGFEACLSFLRASDELVSETLRPGSPLTQAEMNAAAGQSLYESELKLESAVVELRAKLEGEELAAFDRAQQQWRAYCAALADFEAFEVSGGTMWPTVHAGAAEAEVKRRTAEIQAFRRMEDQT
jgi:uncharacterized protein YecT (DUF1311 family)